MQNNKIEAKAIIFYPDGTIVDSKGAYVEATKAGLLCIQKRSNKLENGHRDNPKIRTKPPSC
jgi:phosphoglycolate phosphatase-like HAD superfamily hydrolase